MKNLRHYLIISFIIAPFLGAGQILIRHVSIADVENKKWIKPRDVLIESGIISAIGIKLSAPAGFEVIDGTGKFLIPGFVDSHIHFSQSGGVYTRPDAIDLSSPSTS